ncbi:MAE_28990/MAE_18760 family HEPN-like nuclease [Merismopedia glauca]
MGSIEWQVYDSCAAVTRLYAIYESFVENLIGDWVRLLPKIVSNYSELGEKIQNTHREGTARLLLDLNKNRFQHLSIEKVVQGLFDGISHNQQYELLPEAFLLHEQNLRKEALEKLLADAGIENSWKWVLNSRKIKHFIEEVSASQNRAEGELKRLIDYRNEAAHGSVDRDQILGSQELLDLCDFIEAFCQALVELVSYQVICKKVYRGEAREIGTIAEWFTTPNAAVVKVKEVTLSVGSSLWLISETSSYCQLARIESIKVNDISKEQVNITSEIEVGLQLNREAKKGLSIYLVEEN